MRAMDYQLRHSDMRRWYRGKDVSADITSILLPTLLTLNEETMIANNRKKLSRWGNTDRGWKVHYEKVNCETWKS